MDATAPLRTLVAGFGNELRADDGFGVAVIRQLQARGPIPSVDVIEIGTAGIRLAQELLTPYDRLVIVDAMARGGAPGTVYVVAVDAVEPPGAVDMHLAAPAHALAAAKALGALPREVFIVGCEPAEVDELTTEMTPAVQAAIDTALEHIDQLLPVAAAEAPSLPPPAGTGAADPEDPVEHLRRRDEILQIMFWIQAEGLGPDVAVADVLRFVDDEIRVGATLRDLAQNGYADVIGDGPQPRYRLSPQGLREGRRRFMDEFEPYLAKHGHGECGSADCDCHRGGAAACRNLP